MRGKSPCNVGTKCDHKHTKTVQRWVKRKREESEQNRNEQLNMLADAGGGKYARKNLSWARRRLEKIKSELRKRDRQILANTSLRDLIGKKGGES